MVSTSWRAVGGVNATTLSQRLERLEALGVIAETVESTMPPRSCYQLTGAGRELETVISTIDRWGRAHMRQDVPGAMGASAA